jgi:maltose O-acetyltransferase
MVKGRRARSAGETGLATIVGGRASGTTKATTPTPARQASTGAARPSQVDAAKAAGWVGKGGASPAASGWASWRRRLAREARSLAGSVDPRLRFWAGCARLLPCFSLESVRAHMYRLGGCAIARGVALQGPLSLQGKGAVAGRLQVGEGSIIAPGVTFGLDGPITIGRNVNIGPGAALYTATHALGFGSRRMQLAVLARPIVVEDGVWIGMRSLILPGVTLGRGCVVSAGAVVTESVPPNSLAAGNPATVRETLPFGDR